MRVKLADLKPNPLRDFGIDPIQPDRVDALVPSIKTDDWWGGVVARPAKDGKGGYELACGHHRWKAAQRVEGLDEVEIVVKDLSDEDMLRIYSQENSTQRGNSVAAVAGSVMSALRLLMEEITAADRPLTHEVRTLRHRIATKNGLGAVHVLPFIRRVIPGISSQAVAEQLANLKMSGAYAALINSYWDNFKKKKKDFKVDQRLMRSHDLQWLTDVGHFLYTAADEAANNNPRVFDFEGVSKIFEQPTQIKAFREIVTSAKVLQYLNPADNPHGQAELAKKIKADAAARDMEPSTNFIRDNTIGLLMEAKRTELKEKKAADDAEVRGASAEIRMRHYMREFARYARGMTDRANQMTRLYDQEKDKASFTPTGEMRKAIDAAKRMVDTIHGHVWFNMIPDGRMSLEEIDDTVRVLEARVNELKRVRHHMTSEELGYETVVDMQQRLLTAGVGEK